MEKAKGSIGKIQEHLKGPPKIVGTGEKPQTLADLGITFNESSEWQ
jgi:hypothetical protein